MKFINKRPLKLLHPRKPNSQRYLRFDCINFLKRLTRRACLRYSNGSIRGHVNPIQNARHRFTHWQCPNREFLWNMPACRPLFGIYYHNCQKFSFPVTPPERLRRMLRAVQRVTVVPAGVLHKFIFHYIICGSSEIFYCFHLS